MFMGGSYIAFIVLTMVIGLGAQWYVNRQISKFSRVRSSFGMTGAQMAPTTLMGQTASTAPAPTGRCEDNSGYPVKMAEILAMLPGVCYSERVTEKRL